MSTSCIEFGKVNIFEQKKIFYKVVKFSRNLSKNTFMKLWFLPFILGPNKFRNIFFFLKENFKNLMKYLRICHLSKWESSKLIIYSTNI